MSHAVLRIARHDFLNVRRSRLLRGVVGAYVLFTALLVGTESVGDPESATELFVGVTGITAVALPVVAIVAGYLAVAGEREAGTIKLRLGLPDSRRALVAGKLLSRGLTVVLGLVAACLVALALAFVLFGGVDSSVLGRFAAVSVLFALSNVAIAVGLSAMAATRARATTLGFGFYVCWNVLWLAGSGYVVDGARAVADLAGVTLTPAAAGFVGALSPVGAYLEAMDLAFAAGPSGPLPWFGVAVLLAWAVAVPSLGYWRFRSAELA